MDLIERLIAEMQEPLGGLEDDGVLRCFPADDA